MLRSELQAWAHSQNIPHAAVSGLLETSLGLTSWVVTRNIGHAPLVIGIQGAQGSGKSTHAALLQKTLATLHGRSSIVLSLDDFYLTKREREGLATSLHPLLATRGVPGTHDIALFHQVLDQLTSADDDTLTRIPRFDKALDDRVKAEEFDHFPGRPDIILLEGWCIGTPPEPEDRLTHPQNALEAREDPDGSWRRSVNLALKGPYAQLFKRVDRWVMLKVPNLEIVLDWRKLQEEKLQRARGTSLPGVMDTEAIHRFIRHFERLTRWNLVVMPKIADLILELGHEHTVQNILFRTQAPSSRNA